MRTSSYCEETPEKALGSLRPMHATNMVEEKKQAMCFEVGRGKPFERKKSYAQPTMKRSAKDDQRSDACKAFALNRQPYRSWSPPGISVGSRFWRAASATTCSLRLRADRLPRNRQRQQDERVTKKHALCTKIPHFLL